MEVDLLKRNTDCVYYLASPFTCKKGIECEYRHSEPARLNPRDCWYWLSGSCLNPACAFRHPPMESYNEASTEAAPSLPNQTSVPAKKTTVPCYFYFNGFCKNGGKCPFLHEAGDTTCLKSKMANAGGDAPVLPLDSKTGGRADTGRIPAGKQFTLSESSMKAGNGSQSQQRQLVHQSATAMFPEPNTLVQSYIPQREESVAVKPMSLQPVEASIKSESEPSLASDQISEELIDGNIVRDEWLESSPGFDVLVDGKTEDNIVYEDDPEYLNALAGDDGDCEPLYMPHGYAHQTEYDERRFFDNGLYESSEHFEDERRTNFREFSSRRTRDRKARRVVASKRDIFCVGSPAFGHHHVDLRDYLQKRRMIEGYLETHGLVHQVRDMRHERFQRHVSSRLLHGRIASKVERNGARLPRRRRSSVVEAEQRGRPRVLQHNGFEQYNGLKAQQTLTERKSSSKRERYAQQSTTFYGPKSLAEIKEDRKLGHSNNDGSVDFEGPKPLCEILKYKKRTASSGDGFMSNSN